jgi:hypothetical protein
MSIFKLLNVGSNMFRVKPINNKYLDFTQIRWSEEFEANKMPKIVQFPSYDQIQ